MATQERRSLTVRNVSPWGIGSYKISGVDSDTGESAECKVSVGQVSDYVLNQIANLQPADTLQFILDDEGKVRNIDVIRRGIRS